ncbi:Zn-ribbon domain-containing OB-fold protein [Nocardia cyriacigeorgica]|uniref:Zn-ribbon domain-containing OB-fold protein n=1 Tax=Nocardia cyriacigeorgica TaxID=135487 RepID=A0ABX0CRA0_9NOCA|nr:Zn-ribbon domain-containing OB-fold protein [Nocardia cyriacigeorgica]NEW40039.1 Zn-ribbon domain-containing OB-fold protein [Nocardia cyriacigeorgica]NEW51635.1 Zn-ribbon domain-containing OB-fold protein [Nocardia cyriacigeorgica]NEW57772.1 Zn-ribbon domain-containing OB-fold protein [Nocardia cyriacigeorgica]
MSRQLPEPVTDFTNPFQMDYTYVAGVGRSVFLRGLAQRRLLARRCPSCAQVYLPPPEFCSRCLTELSEPLELPGDGTISTFCVVNFPFPGQVFQPPYVVAYIQVRGADTRLMHLIQEIEPSEVRIGMAVEPFWCADDELDTSMNSIRYYRPATATESVSTTGGSDA